MRQRPPATRLVESETDREDDPEPNLNRPEVQVEAKPQRRRFTAQYKLSILEQADACTNPGELSALLRREGLYASNLTAWRLAREQGPLAALQPRQRGRKAKPIDPRDRRIAELEKQLAAEQARRGRIGGLLRFYHRQAA